MKRTSSHDPFQQLASNLISSTLVLLALTFLPVGSASREIQVTCHPPELWGVSDAELGVAGGLVEDFEDVSLVVGLQLEIADSDGNFTGAGVISLPAVFDPVLDDPFGEAFVLDHLVFAEPVEVPVAAHTWGVLKSIYQ